MNVNHIVHISAVLINGDGCKTTFKCNYSFQSEAISQCCNTDCYRTSEWK